MRTEKKFTDREMVEVGSTVIMMADLMMGVVLKQSSSHPDLVLVRFWNHRLHVYDEVVRSRHELNLLQDPVFTTECVRFDAQAREAYKHQAIELAIATKDEGWFKQMIVGNNHRGV